MKGLFYFRGSPAVPTEHTNAYPLLRGDGDSAEPFAILFPKPNIVILAVCLNNPVLFSRIPNPHYAGLKTYASYETPNRLYLWLVLPTLAPCGHSPLVHMAPRGLASRFHIRTRL